jgi:hypothetical protein
MNKGEINMVNSSSKNVVDTGFGHRRCPGFQGGLGVKPSASKNNFRAKREDFFGNLAPESMLASPKIPYSKTKITNTTKIYKKSKQTQNLMSQCLNNIAILSLSLALITSCSTTTRKTEKMDRVLENQNHLLKSVKAERQSESVARMVEKDAAFRNSEKRLIRAIDALLKSNKMLRQATKNREGK